MIVREARLEDAPAIARVHVDTWRTAYRGIMPEDYLASLSYKRREHSWVQMLGTALKNNCFTYVAESEAGQIVGFADGGPERARDMTFKGELYAIYILNDYQRQGVGRRLVLSTVERLFQSGLHSLLVWALADNPACGFYEALGGYALYERHMNLGGARLREIAYGWTDVEILLHSI